MMSKRFQRETTTDKQTYNYNNIKKKYYKIFILTKDDYYLIVEKRKLYKSSFFKNIFDLDKTSGNINNPMFLKEKHSSHLKCVIEYLNFYFDKIDYFDDYKNISYNHIDKYYNNFDLNFLNNFKNYSIQELKDFITMISYYNVISLNKKLELYLFFKINQTQIN